jgi:hypothetical protein
MFMRAPEMFWWLTEMYDKKASEVWTASERRAVLGAWIILVLSAATIMLPLDYFLIFRANWNDVLSSALSGGAAPGAGIAISGFVSPRVWPVLSRPRVLSS